MLAIFAAVALVGSKPFSFYGYGPYEKSVPRPEQILHYAAGERQTTFREQEMVFRSISESCRANVRTFDYGMTPEGRPLRIYAVSSSENISKLGEIQKDHERLSKGEGEAKNVVPIVWINECIHGDETASFESAMWTFYNLAATRDSKLSAALKHVVVMINPVYNPDGHERYVVYYNSIATGSPNPEAFEEREPSIVYGRLNHYRFDMNRDRIAFSQLETREEFAEMLKWNPQVYIDQHGQVGSYFFPPEPMSINENVDRARNAKWTDYFGRATGKAFDAQGMSYFVKDEFDLYYPGYIDSSNTLTGAIGMTHETDGGRVLAIKRPDGSILTQLQGMAKHFTSALAVVEAAADRGPDLMDDYARFKRKAVNGTSAGTFQRVVLSSSDPRPLLRFRDHLARGGIASYFASPFSQPDAHDYWSGKTGRVEFKDHLLVVDLAQSQGAFAKALLEPQSSFEPAFVKAQLAKKSSAPEGEKYPGPEASEFYDLTGWALPYAYDLKTWWCDSAPPIEKEADPKSPSFMLTSSSVGYALRYTDQDDILAVMDALEKGARAVVTNKPMTLGTEVYPRGTFLFLAGRNDENYEKILFETSRQRGVRFEPLQSSFPEDGREGPGSESTTDLRRPKIAIVMGSGDRMYKCGPSWFLFEKEFKEPFTFIGEDVLSQDLGDFTCVVLPEGASLPRSDSFKNWLSAGNVAVLLGNARAASAFQDLQEVKGDVQALPGSLFRANLDLRSFLTLGYDSTEIAAPLAADQFFTRRKEGGSVITLSGDPKFKKLLTGWEWPDETEKSLQDVVFLQDIPVGQGRLVVFTQDPLDRAMWPGLYKLFLNAVVIGSGR
jgi:hypothetical protein